MTLSPFLIAKYEVSQAEWKRVRDTNPSRRWGDSLPIHSVAWRDCQAFCREVGLYLPSEAQWEYACRAGTDTLFSFGDQATSEDEAFNLPSPVSVGSFGANPFGLPQAPIPSTSDDGFILE